MQDELVIEPGRSFQNYWRDLWRYRGAVLHSRLARCGGALQTDGGGSGVGVGATVREHGGHDGDLRQNCRAAIGGRRAVPDDGLRRHAAVAIFFQLAVIQRARASSAMPT